ncbi:MAG: UvrB/UvrC motif-containing protein [Limisphaerales bacterium]
MAEKKMCSVCKEKPAALFLSNISTDGKKQDLDLCDACAKTKGLDGDPTAFLVPDADIMLGLGAAQEITQTTGGVELKCPRCGFSQADFKKSGRLGCPECYQVFAEGLEGLLKTMHKGTRHTGKAPEALRKSRDNAERFKLLQKKLAKAIESEDFEQAAKVRDELKEIAPHAAETVRK